MAKLTPVPVESVASVESVEKKEKRAQKRTRFFILKIVDANGTPIELPVGARIEPQLVTFNAAAYIEKAQALLGQPGVLTMHMDSAKAFDVKG